jgi:hypothetical protein
MFAFRVGTLTGKLTRADLSQIDTSNYLFGSNDPPRIYLETSLAKLRTTLHILERTDHFFDQAEFKVYIHVVIWLSTNYGVSKTELDMKYPNMVADMLSELEAKKATRFGHIPFWVAGRHRELPNLMHELVHHGRLGAVIDEVLGLNTSQLIGSCLLL